MKRSLYIVFLMMFLTGNLAAVAQDQNTTSTIKKKKEKGKSFIEVTGGVSVPLGNFAKTNYFDLRSGFAGLGPVLSISGVKYIGHNFGLGGTFSYASYNMKNVSNIALGYQQDYDVDSTNVHAGHYTAYHILVGPYYSIPLGIVTIEFRALAGVNIMTTPRIDVLLEDGGNSYTYGGTAYTFWQLPSTAAALATQLGVGLRVSPVKHFAISARVDYFYSQPVFNFTNVNRYANTGRLETSYTQPFNGINASLGLVYEFGKKITAK